MNIIGCAHKREPMSAADKQLPNNAVPFLKTVAGCLGGYAFGHMVAVETDSDTGLIASLSAFAFGTLAGYKAYKEYDIKNLSFLSQYYQEARIKTEIVEIMGKIFKLDNTETPTTTVQGKLKTHWHTIKLVVDIATKELIKYSRGGERDVKVLSHAREAFKDSHRRHTHETYKALLSELISNTEGCKNLTDNEKNMLINKIMLLYYSEHNKPIENFHILNLFPQENRDELKNWAENTGDKNPSEILTAMKSADSTKPLFSKDEIMEIEAKSIVNLITIRSLKFLDYLEKYNVVLSEDPDRIIEFKQPTAN